jgi:pimeloyl-ACP methyl ester carboxylesterase
MRFASRMTWGFILVGCFFYANFCLGQTTVSLPLPTGSFGVGRVACDWVDQSRPDTESSAPNAKRELMVYVWYPISQEHPSSRATYLPNARKIDSASNKSEDRGFSSEVWPLVAAGSVRTNAFERAPPPEGNNRFPVLLFFPGRGIRSLTYTSMIEDIVSHGYVVAAVDPPYVNAAIVLANGSVVLSKSESPRPKTSSRDEFVRMQHAFDVPRYKTLAQDMRFVLDRLKIVDASTETNGARLSGRLNLEKVGAFGHSLGGRVAALACNLDQRFKACLDGDGVGPEGPIFEIEGKGIPSQAFMWEEVHHDPPTAAQVAPGTIEEWAQNHQLTIEASEKQMEACKSGSYHVQITTPGINHLSFTDVPLIEAGNDPLAKARAVLSLRAITAYELAFFDRTLLHHDRGILPSTSGASESVVIRSWNLDSER